MKLFRGEIELKGEYQLVVKDKGFKVLDNEGNRVYFEDSNGYWFKQVYDDKDNIIYYENDDGYWEKYEYDNNGNVTYYEDSEGKIGDNRPKVELTLKEIADKFEVDLIRLRIKDE